MKTHSILYIALFLISPLALGQTRPSDVEYQKDPIYHSENRMCEQRDRLSTITGRDSILRIWYNPEIIDKEVKCGAAPTLLRCAPVYAADLSMGGVSKVQIRTRDKRHIVAVVHGGNGEREVHQILSNLFILDQAPCGIEADPRFVKN